MKKVALAAGSLVVLAGLAALIYFVILPRVSSSSPPAVPTPSVSTVVNRHQAKFIRKETMQEDSPLVMRSDRPSRAESNLSSAEGVLSGVRGMMAGKSIPYSV